MQSLFMIIPRYKGCWKAVPPGTDWQPGSHTVKTQFRLNDATDQIMIWTSTGPTGSYYGETQLSVNDLTDENGNHVLTFTNKLGQVVSKKVQADATAWLETITIYDDMGNILYQVSPEGVKRIYGASPPALTPLHKYLGNKLYL